MTWDQLSVNKPHLAYLILGGFTSLFMLCSLFVKERLYIGEATVAALCGVIFGPHAANIFNPISWGNSDQITLECSRVVLVVQCFAVGVELPKAYMERHWRSVIFLLVPVMTFGWLVTSLVIWWMVGPLNWLESLMCAACVTATDPVLASSVVGKGKFAKRVPRHLRDLLSAESGCNDGMAFPFIYLSFYLIHYKLNASQVTFHWFCNTILYECIFGAIYGVLIGYLARHAIKWADRHNLVDRESFLVFYFVLALFCAGTGATLGTDDLLVGFAAGVGFSNDGWFTKKTEESHVSNVIDLLLNLAYFVYLGAIIPWEQYNNPVIGLSPWRLVVIAIFVVFFRRIPIMMALKPLIPDIKTWREALFAGHFGPIGVGAIFAAILARAELETDTTTPLAVVPTDPDAENYAVVQIIWPLTTFLVVTSILVHGSSIAVFTLGKRINQFTLTMSYTQANEEGPSWMNRLPRMASTARSSMSKGKDDFSATSSMEKLDELPPGTLPPVGLPGNFLRRQREEDTPIEAPRAVRSRLGRSKSGGHVEQSAIAPVKRSEVARENSSRSDTLNEKGSPSGSTDEHLKQGDTAGEVERKLSEPSHAGEVKEEAHGEPELEVYEEGDNELVVEDEEGNIVNVHHVRGESDAQKRQHILDDEKIVRKDSEGKYAKDKDHPHAKNEGEDIEEAAKETVNPQQRWQKLSRTLSAMNAFKKPGKGSEGGPSEPPREKKETPPDAPKSGQAAHAYRFGQTLIVEDEDGEVISTINLGSKAGSSKAEGAGGHGHGHLNRLKMGGWTSALGGRRGSYSGKSEGQAGESSARQGSTDSAEDPRLRFTVSGGRRLNKQEFIQELQAMDPKSRRQAVEESSAPSDVKAQVSADADRSPSDPHRSHTNKANNPSLLSAVTERRSEDIIQRASTEEASDAGGGMVRRIDTVPAIHEPPSRSSIESNRTKPDEPEHEIPTHDVTRSLRRRMPQDSETAAQRRRREAAENIGREDSDSEDDGTERIPPHFRRSGTGSFSSGVKPSLDPHEETAAERRRRLAALGEENDDSSDDGGERKPPGLSVPGPDAAGPASPSSPTSPGAAPRIRFASDQPSQGISLGATPAVSQARSITWGEVSRSDSKAHGDGGEEHSGGNGGGGKAAGKVKDVGRRLFKR